MTNIEMIIKQLREKIKELILLYDCDKIHIDIDCNKKMKNINIKVMQQVNFNE